MGGGGGRDAAVGPVISWLRGVAKLPAEFAGAAEEVGATGEGDG